MLTAWKRFNYAFALRILRVWAKPTACGVDRVQGVGGAALVYALANRSLADILLLDLLAAANGLPSPVAPLTSFDETRRFFFLNRPSGFWRRNTMLAAKTTSERMRRLQAKLAEDAAAPAPGEREARRALWLAPVSIFWGRAANKDRSWIRSLFSEGWAVSSRLRRLLILIFNRRDILVAFGEPLPWHDIAAGGAARLSQSRLTRRTARLLRVKFRNEKVAAIGPDLSHRRTLAAQVLRSSQVAAAVAAEASQGRGRERLERKARKAVLAIAADMSYPATRVLDRLLTGFWRRVYEGVRVSGIERLRAVAQTHTVVYVPCHRSHIDYLLLSHVLHHRGLMIPHIAAGDNLDLPVVGGVLRRGGAFFMRRSFARDRVYAAVFAEYLYQVFRRGHSVEYFIEGGRTRTGRLLPARAGLLQMTLDAHRRGLPRPLAFAPVFLGYEKVIEAGSYVDELRGATKKSETIGDVLRGLRLARQFLGTAQVCFGEPIRLAPFLAATSGDPGRALAARIPTAINACAFVNATNLVALAMLSTARQAIEETALIEQIELYRRLAGRAPKAMYEVEPAPAEEIVRRVERLGLLDRQSSSTGADVLGQGRFAAVLMTWYRNNIVHVLAAPAFAACLVINRRRAITDAHVRRLFATVFPYLANEFHIDADGDPDHWLSELEAAGVIERRGGGFVPPADSAARFQLRLLANTVMHILERFYIAAVVLVTSGSGVLDRGALLGACRARAQRISQLYGIGAPEFADARLFEGLLQGLASHGVVTINAEGKLTFDDRIREITRAARGVIAPALRQALEEQVIGGAAPRR